MHKRFSNQFCLFVRPSLTHIILKRMYLFSGDSHQCESVQMEFSVRHCMAYHADATVFNFIFFYNELVCGVSTEWPSGIHVIMMLISSFTLYPIFRLLKLVRLRSHKRTWIWQLCTMRPAHRDTHTHTETWQMTIIFCLLGGVFQSNIYVSTTHICRYGTEKDAFYRALGWICNHILFFLLLLLLTVLSLLPYRIEGTSATVYTDTTYIIMRTMVLLLRIGDVFFFCHLHFPSIRNQKFYKIWAFCDIKYQCQKKKPEQKL